jgi:hypothetical protein
MYKVRIKSLPKAAYGQQVNGALDVDPTSMGGRDFNENPMFKNPGKTKSTLTAVPRDEANLEAEGGETAFGPISGQNIPDHMVIKGKRHHEGGVPLNLPDDTFIFSDTRAMRITDPKILAMFGKKSKKGGYTPAELAKPYNIGKYKSILMDPESSQEERNTAIMMIKNFIIKLGALAIAQESKKGFPQGIPAMAKPYMEANGLTEEDLIPELAEEEEVEELEMGRPTQMPGGQPIAQPMSEEEMMAATSAEEGQIPQQEPMMLYGGYPMAAYGMTMGGFYPEYAFGGNIPRFQGNKGGSTVKSREMTKEELEERSKKATNIRKEKGTGCAPGYVLINGRCVKGSITEGNRSYKKEGKIGKGDVSKFDKAKWEASICDRLKKGATVEEIAYSHGLNPNVIKSKWGSCIQKGQETLNKEDFDIYELETEEQVEVQDCTCTDPVTGETTNRELQPGEECLCPGGTQGQIGQIGQMNLPDNPIWSDVATRGVLTQATMDPNVGRVAFQRMPYQETRPAFEDYLAKSQQIGSNLANVGNNVAMFAGSAGDAAAAMLQAQAQASQANVANVADVQARNINYLNAAEQQDLQARMAADQANINIGAQEMMYNVGAGDKERVNRNQIKANTQYAVQAAEKEMQNRALSNFLYPDYATTYNKGLPMFVGQGRTPVPEKPAKTPAEEYNELLAAGMPQEAAQAIATKHAKYGYVMGSNVFPFMFY